MGSEKGLSGIALRLCLLGLATGWAAAQVRLGADRILEPPYLEWIRGKRVGLVTNHTGTNRLLVPTRELLDRHPEVTLVALFGPEHGIDGSVEAGEKVADRRRVYSLYGENRAPTPESLQGVDVLVYDMQDVGARFYTYISTLFLSMREAARHGIPVVVLDRPNPITGIRLEGPVLEPDFQSFVGIHTLALRHGMTVGELARMFNTERRLGCDLRVVPMEGWSRDLWFDETGLQWIAPSPNLPTLNTAALYPGLCLIEGTNLSEGRGTTRPFQLLGAPWLNSRRLVKELNELQLPGVVFRVQHFTPAFSKYRGQRCAGLEVHVADRDRFLPLTAVLHLLSRMRSLHPDRFSFTSSFDRLVGNRWVRRALEENLSVREIVRRWTADVEAFKKRRQAFLLY